MSANFGMSPTKLANVGRALYGQRWQTALATDLGVSDRTMRRWLTGESPIPSGIEEELQKLLTMRTIEIDKRSELSSDSSGQDKMFTDGDFNKLLTAVFDRGDKRWITPSGSITDVLRGFIKEEKIDHVSTACRFYFKIHGIGAANFVSHQLPSLLINNYKPIIGLLAFDEFLNWSNQNPNWEDEIVKNADSPSLGMKVRDLVASLSAFKKSKK
jgi:hypothetical protein